MLIYNRPLLFNLAG